MKKYLTFALVFSLLATPFIVSALSIGWDRYIVGGERPLYPTDKVHVGAVATTTNATFEVSGNLAVATSTSGCAQFAINGELYSTGTACGSGSLTGTTGQTAYFSGTNTAVGTSTIFISTASAVGVGTTSPPVAGLTVDAGTIFNPEITLATSTSMIVGIASSSNQRLNYSTSAMTITLSTYEALPGMKMTIETCNQTSGTAGAITWVGGHYSGGVQPGNTTTANLCDAWYWQVFGATTTPIIVLTGMLAGIQ